MNPAFFLVDRPSMSPSLHPPSYPSIFPTVTFLCLSFSPSLLSGSPSLSLARSLAPVTSFSRSLSLYFSLSLALLHSLSLSLSRSLSVSLSLSPSQSLYVGGRPTQEATGRRQYEQCSLPVIALCGVCVCVCERARKGGREG